MWTLTHSSHTGDHFYNIIRLCLKLNGFHLAPQGSFGLPRLLI